MDKILWEARRFARRMWQKVTRGWSDEETWNLDIEFAKWMLPRLKRYKELANGYPSHLTPEEWHKAMDTMVRGLETQLHRDELESLIRLGRVCSDKEMKKQWKEVDKAYELLGKYIRYLWW